MIRALYSAHQSNKRCRQVECHNESRRTQLTFYLSNASNGQKLLKLPITKEWPPIAVKLLRLRCSAFFYFYYSTEMIAYILHAITPGRTSSPILAPPCPHMFSWLLCGLGCAFPRNSPGIPQEFTRNSPGISKEFPRNFQGIPQEFLRNSWKSFLRFGDFERTWFCFPQEPILNAIQRVQERPKTHSVYMGQVFA